MSRDNIEEHNVVFIVLDSCRFDTAKRAEIPNILSIGRVRRAFTHGSYTVPAHVAFFSGHLPAVLHKPLSPYYSESMEQLWRIVTGPARDKKKKSGVLLGGNNILEGYRRLGFHVYGIGGVSQFSDGSLLRDYFGEDFTYYGPNLDEEPLEARDPIQFPLNHVDETVARMSDHGKWFLFVNCPETHYPYDWGEGIPDEIQSYYAQIRGTLNQGKARILPETSGRIFWVLHNLQVAALEAIDARIGRLIDKLPRHRDILVVICADHGENFGDVFEGERRWGHVFPSLEVMQVPLVIGFLDRE